ncbi:MAG: hypothetical protein PGN13_16430 [Patulibacter minatonensis]
MSPLDFSPAMGERIAGLIEWSGIDGTFRVERLPGGGDRAFLVIATQGRPVGWSKPTPEIEGAGPTLDAALHAAGELYEARTGEPLA